MDTAEAVRYPGYRWVMLALCWLALLFLLWNIMLPASLAHEFFGRDWSLSQFSMMLTAPTMAAFFFALPGGVAGDRFGIRRVMALAVVLSGVFSVA